MYNSAQALQELLTSINVPANKPKKFYVALVETLGLDEPEGSGFSVAIQRLRKLVMQVERDIDAVSMSDANKNLLRKHFVPFRPLIHNQQIMNTVDALKGGILAPANLVNLTHISMALDGKVETLDLKAELLNFIDETVALREQLNELDIPNSLKKAIDERLDQIHSAVTHFRYWGAEGLEDAVVSLTGEITFFHEQFKSPKGKKVTERVGMFLGATRKLIAKARGYEKDAGWVIEKADEAKNLLENLPSL